MALQALLLSNDPEVHRTIRRVLDAANIDLDLSNNADQARHILLRRKYDALLVDCDDPLTVHKFCSMLPAFEFQARPVVPVEDAVRAELEVMAWRDGLKGK